MLDIAALQFAEVGQEEVEPKGPFLRAGRGLEPGLDAFEGLGAGLIHALAEGMQGDAEHFFRGKMPQGRRALIEGLVQGVATGQEPGQKKVAPPGSASASPRTTASTAYSSSSWPSIWPTAGSRWMAWR